MAQIVYILMALTMLQLVQSHVGPCQPGTCSTVTCDESVTKESCSSRGGYFHPSGDRCGCCPVCFYSVGIGEPCQKAVPEGEVLSVQCNPGLSCHALGGYNGRCKKDAAKPECRIKLPSRECGHFCRYGYRVDPETHCFTCDCNACPGICRMACRYGFKRDSHTGCEICECKPAPPGVEEPKRFW